MNKTLAKIRESLGHMAMEWAPSDWLDTEVPELNKVIGHKEKGLPYGRIIEISGWESQGKSALMMSIAALAQCDGAHVIWEDVENSFDPGWARQRGMAACSCIKITSNNGSKNTCKLCGGENSSTFGLDTDKLILLQPYVGKFMDVDPRTKKKTLSKEARLSNAQELCSEAEKCMEASAKTFKKRILVLDSIPALLTAGEAAAGIEGGNLRTNMDLPMFMSRLLRRWVGTAQVTNTLIVLVNQLRTNPMNKFSSPDYTPGGNAPLFYSHVRVRVNRIKGGKIMDKGNMVGIQGIMRALKNKSGGVEGSTVGYKLKFNSNVEFVPVSSLKRSDE